MKEGGRRHRLGLVAGRMAISAGKVVLGLVPARVRKALDDRFFGAVFQVTRVTNDHYGWRPEE